MSEPVRRGWWRCQFCGEDSPPGMWRDGRCPECECKYDPLLAQEGDD